MSSEDLINLTFQIIFQEKAQKYQQDFKQIGIRRIVDLTKYLKTKLWNKIEDFEKKKWILVEVLSQFFRQDQQIFNSIKILLESGVISLDVLNDLDESDWIEYKIQDLKDHFKKFLIIDPQLKNQLEKLLQCEQRKNVITNLINYQVLNYQTLSLLQESEAISLGFNKIQLKQLLKQNSSQNQQPHQENKRLNDQKIQMIYKFTYPQINERNTAEYKTLIVIGESGSGKTSFLNFLCNYYLGVKSEDNFRFLLIKENLYGKSQAMSQTQDINIYYLRPYDKLVGLKIIDTPGFGDSRGIEQDMKIAQQIKELFQKKVETVTAICFVVKASQSRSTISQNYILNQMKQYFGLDVKQNIIFIFPFSTAENPLAIESLRFQGNESQMANEVSELVNEFIDKSMKTKDEWFFKVDNKAILYNFNSSNEQECQFYKFLWDMSYSSFQKLIENKLLRIKDNSLQLTKAVIAKRDNLVLQVQAYKQKLNKNVELQKAIYDEIEKIEKWDEKISNAKNNIQFYKEKKVKVPISKDESVTNCNICENTCHYICFIDGNNKLYCEAMDDFYNCTICEKKCHYTAHQNDRFRYEINLEADEIEVEKYQKKCQDKKLSKQQILKDIEEQQKQNSVQFLQNAQKIFEIYNELRTIALAPSHYENQAQIVEEMIQQELSEQNDGYVKRVAILRQLKEQLEDIQEVSSKSKSIANEEQQGKKDQLEDLLKPSQSLTSTNRSRSVAPTKRS